MVEERLQKIISRAGIASRRKAEDLIESGRVTVNHIVMRELGTKADLSRDEVRVDGKQVRPPGAPLYFMVHKPEGYVTTTSDPEGRPTVMDLIRGAGPRLHPIGRLDFATSGLLLLTTDGDMTRFLTHPSSRVEKTYLVKVRERIGPDKIKKLASGPKIEGRRLRPARVRFSRPSRGGRHSWIEVVITEGKTRQVRKMCEAVGHPVIKLRRVAIGPLKLGSLERGDLRPLTYDEVMALQDLMAGRSRRSRRGGRRRR